MLPSTVQFETLEFRASLQLRTPRRVLLRHGEIHGDRDRPPPSIASEAWQGRWIPRYHTSLAPDGGAAYAKHLLDRVPSDAGRVEPRDYLPFLLSVRAIAESDGSIVERRQRLAIELGRQGWHSFLVKLGGCDQVLDSFFPPFISTLEIRRATQDGLRRRGLVTPSRILAASDKELLTVSGLGDITVTKCRALCALARDPEGEFVDMVKR
jgi:hypothetical protein